MAKKLIYNKSSVTFSAFMDELKSVSIEEYHFSLGYNYTEKEFYQYYEQGMDIHEAIAEHQGTF